MINYTSFFVALIFGCCKLNEHFHVKFCVGQLKNKAFLYFSLRHGQGPWNPL